MTTFRDYSCTYRHDGSDWGLTICAQSAEDAKARLKSIGAWGRVDGELVAIIPAWPGAGLFVRFMCWLRNAARAA